MTPKVAFITGANGITGSAIAERLASTTGADEWSRIIITSRSPLKASFQDDRLTFIALDFTNSPQELAKSMKSVCGDVTHAFFSSYVHKDDFTELNTANQALFENFLDSLLVVSKSLECCLLQTGGKYYNVHLSPVPSPASEADPRRETPVGNFYFQQEDYLKEKQKGQSWSWNVVRPEAIVGYTSKPNGMNEAMTIALYFIVCAKLGVEAKMPTNQIYWEGYEDISDSRLIADFSIWAATNKGAVNQDFNITNGDYFCWQHMWPRLAAYFGAKATSDQQFTKPRPAHGDTQLDFSLAEWAEDKRAVWDEVCDEAGCPDAKSTWDSGTWKFQDWVFQRGWSATLSISKAREFGWTGHLDSYKCFVGAFQDFARLGQIPPTAST